MFTKNTALDVKLTMFSKGGVPDHCEMPQMIAGFMSMTLDYIQVCTGMVLCVCVLSELC